jgi:general secretion pathway protein J
MTAADPVRDEISVMTARRDQSGFTLLEMLVGLIVLGMLVIGLNQGVRTGLGAWNMQARQMADVADLTSAARELRMLLTGIPISPAANVAPGSPPLAIALDGTADRLTFVGDLPNGLGATRRADITLLLTDDRLVLRWKSRRPELAGTPRASSNAELLRGVARVQLAYFGAQASGSPVGWLTQWDGPALPELIRVRLNFVKGDTRHWPDLIVAPQLAESES